MYSTFYCDLWTIYRVLVQNVHIRLPIIRLLQKSLLRYFLEFKFKEYNRKNQQVFHVKQKCISENILAMI